jgi:hypothetical protein
MRIRVVQQVINKEKNKLDTKERQKMSGIEQVRYREIAMQSIVAILLYAYTAGILFFYT